MAADELIAQVQNAQRVQNRVIGEIREIVLIPGKHPLRGHHAVPVASVERRRPVRQSALNAIVHVALSARQWVTRNITANSPAMIHVPIFNSLAFPEHTMMNTWERMPKAIP